MEKRGQALDPTANQPPPPKMSQPRPPDGICHVAPQRVDGLGLVDDHVVERLGAPLRKVEAGHVCAAVQSCSRTEPQENPQTVLLEALKAPQENPDT